MGGLYEGRICIKSDNWLNWFAWSGVTGELELFSVKLFCWGNNSSKGEEGDCIDDDEEEDEDEEVLGNEYGDCSGVSAYLLISI